MRKYNKDIGISIFVDNKNKFQDNENIFDSIHYVQSPEYGFGDKIYAMINTPYQKTIYLDCDTIVADNISEIFEMLEKYDLAASNPPFKNKNYQPDSYQAGIVFYKKNEIVKKFLKLWNESYDRINDGNDQPSFRRMVFKLPISFFTFPPNYNFRSPFASYIIGKIKIFHDHKLSLINDKKRQLFINNLNRGEEERYWFPNKGVLKIPNNSRFLRKAFFLYQSKINKNNRIKYKYFLRKKLINYYIIKAFPWLINWIVPESYRNSIKNAYKELMNFSKSIN
ncbi:MAG: hypothetical protein ACFFA4_07575 [Promethearchaeota archaeon]